MKFTTLSNESESVREWLIDNKLSIHLNKTQSILFGTKLSRTNTLKIFCNGAEILFYFVSYLGIILDQSLSCESVVAKILSKSGSKLKFLFHRLRLFLTFLLRNFSCPHWFSVSLILPVLIGSVV